jgi:hypothetical protein
MQIETTTQCFDNDNKHLQVQLYSRKTKNYIMELSALLTVITLELLEYFIQI